MAVIASQSLQDEWTPLMAASINGHVDVVRVLIRAHADINYKAMVIYHIHQ